MTVRAIADRILSTLFEPPCPACGRVNQRPLDGAICAPCWESILPLTPPLCAGCGDALPSWRSASLLASTCPRCRRQPRTVCRMAAFGPYEGTLRAVIHALKYGGRRTAAPPLSALMREAGGTVLFSADAVVPVPLHPLREWSRGFNQAALLARGLGLPVLPVLKRVRHTTPQAALPAAQRHRNVRNAFAVAGTKVPAHPFDGLTLVLVDDVTTTGATLEACARVLISAGAREVRALTAARVVTLPPQAPPR